MFCGNEDFSNNAASIPSEPYFTTLFTTILLNLFTFNYFGGVFFIYSFIYASQKNRICDSYVL